MRRFRRKRRTLDEHVLRVSLVSRVLMVNAGLAVGALVLIGVGSLTDWETALIASRVCGVISRVGLIVGLLWFSWVLSEPLVPWRPSHRGHFDQWFNEE